ncbi:MAG: acyl-CoA dehydrogenase family protein [Xanthomonadales bacterium]|nr:acyl-CoA dehydrogenase family protein [Xanthomonadales bacterium]
MAWASSRPSSSPRSSPTRAAPIQPPANGEILVGPTILHLGSEDQKQRYLRDIARGRTVWCQGFSEPEAGSDLASLETTAVVDGGDLVVHGHKIWTSQAQDADYCFALCRTGDEPRHAGISYLLIPMDQPGVQVRTIAQPDGTAGFAEVFFDGARCSLDDVVGGLGNGWKVAMSTLEFERGTSATSSWQRYARDLDALVDSARESGVLHDPVVRQRIARMWTRIQIMRIDGLRVLTSVLDPSLAHTTSALEAGTKVNWTEFHQELTNLAVDVLGPHGAILHPSEEKAVGVGLGRRAEVYDYPAGPVHQAFLFSRSGTIFGGTSEVQRNIIGERVLGLPRGPR